MSPQPSEPVAESLLLFNAAPPGTYPQSRDAVYRDSRNAVIVEAWPDGTPNPSADVTIIDSELHGGGFNPGVDGAAVKVGLTVYTKWVVPSVLSWVRARLVNTTGNWSVRVSPVNVPNAQNVAVSGTSNQGLPNAGGADAWPVTVTDFPATTDVADRAGRQLGTIANTGFDVTDRAARQLGVVTTGGSGAVYCGSQAATAAATALPNQACRKATIENDPASASNLLIGSATAQTISLAPGQSADEIEVNNLNLLYIKVAAGSATANIFAEE